MPAWSERLRRLPRRARGRVEALARRRRRRRSPPRICLYTSVLPRLEAPFLEEWAWYLASQGVEKLFLLVDEVNGIWSKKPRLAYYCPHLDDAQMQDYWREELKRSRQHLEIETLSLRAAGRNVWGARLRMFPGVKKQMRAEGFDWVLHHDVDEFFVPKRHATLADYLAHDPGIDAVRVRQLVFESRWDPADGHRPRPVVAIRNYHPKVVPLTKVAARLDRLKQLNTHDCVLRTGLERHESPDVLVMHHYRGVEKAHDTTLAAIEDFPAVLEEPLYRR